MATSALSVPLIPDQESAVETTPLLTEPPAQQRTRRQSSIVGDTHQGFHVIPGTSEAPEVEIPQHSLRAVFAALSVLLIGLIFLLKVSSADAKMSTGVFISNADGTLVLATLGTISSEFNDLQNGVWLTSSFGLATCAAQPLVNESPLRDEMLTNDLQYGKLSDIFGRKATLQVAYLIFALGSAISYVFKTLNV